MAPYLVGSIILALLAANDWIQALLDTPRNPWVSTAIASVFIPVAVFKMLQGRKRLEQLKLARDGERVVGEILEGIREDGARIFHDVPGDGFNVDHVVLTSKGFFVVETKTYRKPSNGRVTFAESELRIAGYRPNRDPVKQTQAAAKWLRALLEDLTGKRFPVRGAVVFPGWFIEPMSAAWKNDKTLPWVLEPTALPKFIGQEPAVIEMSDVSLAAHHLATYVRSKNEKR
jgi:hypothetical protein